MNATLLTPPEQRWVCPNCVQTAVTHEARPHTEFHFCRGLLGMWAPMVAAGTRCKVELVRRGDYVGNEVVQVDGEGRPVMSAQITRDDGMDCAIYAPMARASRRELA